MFSKSTYIDRRRQLMQDTGTGLILLYGNEEAPMNYADNLYPFRQDSSFLYFAGLDLPHLAVLLDTSTATTTLFGDELTMDDIVWMGPHPTLHELADQVGIERVLPYADLAKALHNAMGQSLKIHYLPPYRGDQTIQLSEWLKIPVGQVRVESSEVLIRGIVKQRMVKHPEEVEEMEKAVHITRMMHLAAMREARPGITEAHLAGVVEGIAVSEGGRSAYGTILTINGHVLHNHEHHNMLREGQLVLGDFGAETRHHYAGDITRTFPVSHAFSAQQKEIYNLVLATEEAAIQAVRPGVSYRDIHLQAALQIAEGLKALDLMQGDMGEAVAAGAHALFFPHGLGHALGMDVHDMEGLGENFVGYRPGLERSTQFGLKSLRLARELEPGFVLTVEPGIYFIPQLIDKWKAEGKFLDFIRYDNLTAYRNFSGIRIEDNVLVTENGHKVLGRPIPKTVEEVEAIRREALS